MAVESTPDARAVLPGLELAEFFQRVASQTSDPARKLLSFLTSSLARRGWVHPIDKMIEAAQEATELPLAVISAAQDELVAAHLLELDGQRIVSLAGLFATRATGLDFVLDGEHALHLTGALSALAASIALQLPGTVRGQCPVTQARLELCCDVSGIASREPETICCFLPAWNGQGSAAAAAAVGFLFADDEALGKWQEDNGDPPGMPMTSFLFPMGATELGQQLGTALEQTLNHLPDFS